MNDIIDTAARIATTAHATQKRKSDDSPYIVHPFAVALKLREHGFSDTVVAAALLHDVIEDTGMTADALRAEVPDEVVELVLALSEDKSKPWEDRKKEYIDTIVGSSEEVKAISVSDKLHNFRGVLEGHAKEGPKFWTHFTRGREKQQWFFKTYVARLRESWAHPLLDELAELVSHFPSD